MVEPCEFIWTQAAADMPGIVAVEHDKLPALGFMGTANLERRAVQLSAHGLGLVVIAGYAQHRLAQAAEEAAEAQISGAIVLHKIAGDQHGRVIRNAGKRIVERRAQTRIGFYAAQPAAGAAIEVWVGDV